MRASPVFTPDPLNQKFRVGLGISATNKYYTGTLGTLTVTVGRPRGA